jgi:hypothetical protein
MQHHPPGHFGPTGRGAGISTETRRSMADPPAPVDKPAHSRGHAVTGSTQSYPEFSARPDIHWVDHLELVGSPLGA